MPPNVQTPSLFETAVHSERYRLQIDGLEHVDSTSYALVEGRKARLGLWAAWDPGGVQRHEVLSRYVSEFFTAFLVSSPASRTFLSRDPQQTMPESGIAVEHREATPAPITYAQFVNELLTGDASRAMDEVRKLRGTQPAHILLNDFYLYRLAYSLLYSWGSAANLCKSPS